ncbi:MAG TPA: DUF4845 domain-containing protein [Terriglobales bacterium]|jgi:hypothetical protein|nr:DUF4845 domain-containing protein [Terriglobales bacterium]
MKLLRGLIALFVVVAGAYVGYKIVPVYFSYYQFQDAMEQEATVQSYTGKSETEMRDSMWKKAQQLELPLASPEAIKVERTGNTVSISTEYTVHIDLPVHPFDVKFTPNSKNKQI